jgi:hypothetical protein
MGESSWRLPGTPPPWRHRREPGKPTIGALVKWTILECLNLLPAPLLMRLLASARALVFARSVNRIRSECLNYYASALGGLRSGPAPCIGRFGGLDTPERSRDAAASPVVGLGSGSCIRALRTSDSVGVPALSGSPFLVRLLDSAGALDLVPACSIGWTSRSERLCRATLSAAWCPVDRVSPNRLSSCANGWTSSPCRAVCAPVLSH